MVELLQLQAHAFHNSSRVKHVRQNRDTLCFTIEATERTMCHVNEGYCKESELTASSGSRRS